MSSESYYPALDGVRAYSAMGIIAMHVLANIGFVSDGFVFDWLIPSFTNLVFLFMIISSFAMCCGYYEKMIGGHCSLKHFYAKRFGKIWPFFALVCLLECGVSMSPDALWETLANLTMFFGFIDENISIVGVGWFLGIISIFYMIYPFFCCLLSEKRVAWAAFAGSLLLNLVSGYYFDLGRTNFAFSFVYLMAGGLIFLYREELARVSARYNRLLWGLCGVAAAACCVWGFLTWLSILLYSLCVIAALGSKGWILNNSIVRFVSGISLEIYLCHMPVFRVLEKLKVPVLLGGGVLAYIVTYVLTVIGAICVASTFNAAFRAGTIRLGNRKSAKPV